MTNERKQAIESGVHNAVDTVIVDRTMTRDQAFAQLESFVSDGLSCAGLSDIVTREEMRYARDIFPI